MAAAICLAILGAGGSYAYLNASAPVSAATTIKSGTATLTVSTLTLPAGVLYPGVTVSAPVTVTNVGNVPLALRIAGFTPPAPATTLSASLSIGLFVGACPALPAPTWSAVLNTTPVVTSLGKTLPVGGSTILCVSVTLPLSAPATTQGLSAANFGIVIDGIQA
ncbi:hypothetical protein KIV56_08920 [Cryobacterium breve]|uniref:DUF11 domain-containing protein n=1 Tax=Cryobacterium breve TaxID=1259258 RepID=A0ABY7NK57_9MICO|nr:hypothetical protein [Cryobacterium breve]WBM81276.1 hypothetical protein KIV56_08920 [Cryobacterium breve]